MGAERERDATAGRPTGRRHPINMTAAEAAGISGLSVTLSAALWAGSSGLPREF
jgi:hypothetical protein